MLLATAAGLAGFLAVCATALILVWVIEELEDQRCPECAAVATTLAADPASSAASVPGADRLLPGLAAAGALAGLPAFAVSAPPSRVRATGRARHAETPVLLERDRRDPRRHRTATAPELPTAASVGPDAVADPAPELDQVAHQYLPDVAA
jgi:hypothetical protein